MNNFPYNFNRAFEEVISIEGGYVNNPKDPGGETKFGISKRAFPNIDIKSLTLNEAKSIYWENYWSNDRLNLDMIDDYCIQLELFDTAVNMGVSTAAMMLQEALNLLNRNERNYLDLTVDGWIGETTLNAFKKSNKDILEKVLNGLQFMRYVEIVRYNPEQEVFFNGWMKRV